jgi:hypothetical protein
MQQEVWIILLCLTPDNFTCQRESARTQWDKIVTVDRYGNLINPLNGNAPRCALLYYFTLSNVRQTNLLVRGECCHSMHGLIRPSAHAPC